MLYVSNVLGFSLLLTLQSQKNIACLDYWGLPSLGTALGCIQATFFIKTVCVLNTFSHTQNIFLHDQELSTQGKALGYTQATFS
jgi:hypothetical protein